MDAEVQQKIAMLCAGAENLLCNRFVDAERLTKIH
jgi:hypothetical protein